MKNTQIVRIPGRLADRDLGSFFSKWKWPEIRDKHVVMDFLECEFMAPWAMTLFSSYALWLKEAQGCKVEVKYDPSSRLGVQLNRGGVIQTIDPAQSNAESETNKLFVPLHRISHQRDIGPFASNAVELMQIGDSEVEEALRYSLIELLRNVVQHSMSKIGGLAMAQYFPGPRVIELCVADVGVGIKRALQSAYPEVTSDFSALKAAVLPHVSGTFLPGMYATMKDNAGLGLFFVKEISQRSGGKLCLGSGQALYAYEGDSAVTKNTTKMLSPRGGWPGSFAVLHLKKGLIGDFSSLLAHCIALSQQVRDDPYIQALEFVDNISEVGEVSVVPVMPFLENVEEAARVRERQIIPDLQSGKTVILDFDGVKVITQSFAHALFFEILRRQLHVRFNLRAARCTDTVVRAITAVAAYAKTKSK